MMKILGDSPGAVIVSLLVVVIFAVLVVYAMVKGIGDSPTLQLIIGAEISAFSTVVSYWLGSSSSSKGKDATIAAMAAPPAPTPAPSPPNRI